MSQSTQSPPAVVITNDTVVTVSGATPRHVVQLGRATAIRIAGQIPCDPRTVQAYFAGKKTSLIAQQAIRRALASLGIADPRPAPVAP